MFKSNELLLQVFEQRAGELLQGFAIKQSFEFARPNLELSIEDLLAVAGGVNHKYIREDLFGACLESIVKNASRMPADQVLQIAKRLDRYREALNRIGNLYRQEENHGQ